MTRSTRFIVTILIGMMTGQSVFSQYYVKFKSDSLGFVKDSVILSIQAEAADIEWQVSNDSVTWYSLDETSDTLMIRIDSCAFYRAVLTDGTCYPLKSDVAQVAFQSLDVSGNAFTVDPTGGVYIMPSGIKIIVPPGAVSEPASLSMDLLDKNQADSRLPFGIFAGREFYAAMYCNPAGIHFQKPVRLVIPAANYKYTDLPCIYLYNPDSELWNQYFGNLLCSEDQHFIEFSIEEIFPFRIELIKDAFSVTGGKGEKGITEDIPCEEKLVQIVTKAHEITTGYLKGGTCTFTSNAIEAVFLSCKDRPVSKDFMQEISEQCKPTVTARWVGDECFYGKGAKAHIIFDMQIAGVPLIDNLIMLDLPSGLVKIDPEGDIKTFLDGSVIVEVECTVDNLKGKVEYDAVAEYFLRIQKVSGPNGSAEGYDEKRTVLLSNNFLELVPCPEVTRLRINSNTPDPFQCRIKQNETYQITKGCYDSNGVKTGPCLCEYYIDHTVPAGKAVIDLNPETGVFKTIGGGIAYVKARLKGTNLESNMHEIKVPFEGPIEFNMVNENVRRCYCDENPDWTVREWFLMSYWTEGLIRLHLYEHEPSSYYPENNVGYIEGEQTFAYTSTSEYCGNFTSGIEKFYGGYFYLSVYDPWKIRARLVDYDYLPCSTQDILDGKRFELSFNDCPLYTVPGIGMTYHPVLICKMNSAGDIEYTTAAPGDWLGEECVGRVIITGVLH